MSLRSRSMARAAVAVSAFCALLTMTAGTASASPPSTTLKLASLAFTPAQIDARSGGVSTLTWTVTNSDHSANGMGGDLTLVQVDAYGAPFGLPMDIPFSYQTSGFGWMARWVSGTPRKSTYAFDFAPSGYGAGTHTTWVVTHVTVTDGTHTLDSDLSRLGRFGNTLTTLTNPDTVLPVHDSIAYSSPFGGSQPYVYVGPQGGSAGYTLGVQDWQSGFWKGSLTLTGPTGQKVTTDFALQGPTASFSGYTCGFLSSGDSHGTMCGVSVAFPADAAAGVWTLSQIVLYDNAGNRSVDTAPQAPSLTLTHNVQLSASGFAFTPNPVNNWTDDVLVPLSMTVAGAVGGVAAIYVDRGNADGCMAWGSTPTVNADGTVSVPVRIFQATPQCSIGGIAVVDGAGNVALYGSLYGAPDPGLVLKQIPDTTPPVVTAATLSSTSVPANTPVSLTVTLAPSLAPVDSIGVYVYDADGNTVNQSFGGISPNPDGTVTTDVPVFWLPPGTYAIGFTLGDAARLSSWYGVPGFPAVPGGPLVLTITP